MRWYTWCNVKHAFFVINATSTKQTYREYDVSKYCCLDESKIIVYQLDSFSCGNHGIYHPFPTNRVVLEYVGSVYVNKQRRQSAVDILRQDMTLPSKCGLDQISKRQVITDDFDLTSALINSTRPKK